MDPALPLFSFDNPGGRLDKGDASYVDVIHTCGGWLGFERGLGHADFYPNGGSFTQPGCGSDITGNTKFEYNYDFKKTRTSFVYKIFKYFTGNDVKHCHFLVLPHLLPQ